MTVLVAILAVAPWPCVAYTIHKFTALVADRDRRLYADLTASRQHEQILLNRIQAPDVAIAQTVEPQETVPAPQPWDEVRAFEEALERQLVPEP